MKQISADTVRRAGEGNTEAAAELWEAVQKFVYLSAHRYKRGTGINAEADELINQAFLYLQKAAASWDEMRGGFLSWYAYYIKKAFREVSGRGSRKIDPMENYISLDSPIGADADGQTLADTIPAAVDYLTEAEERQNGRELRRALDDALRRVPVQRARRIDMHYFGGMSYAQINAVCGDKMAYQYIRRGLRDMRQDAELRRKLDGLTPFYLQVGIESFRNTRESAVERIVFKRDRIFQALQAKQEREKESAKILKILGGQRQ